MSEDAEVNAGLLCLRSMLGSWRDPKVVDSNY